MDIEVLRRHNPDLDEERGHKAMLLLANAETSTANLTEEDWDALVDHLTLSCSAAAMLLKGRRLRYERRTYRKKPKTDRRRLNLYCVNADRLLIEWAIWSGFFAFSTPCDYPFPPNSPSGGVVCLELGGRTSKVPSANGVEPGGRIVMDDAVSQLRVGKKSMKWLEKATDASYMLTINRDYDRVCKEIINQHGEDWFGLQPLRDIYRSLHYQPTSRARTLSIELWQCNGKAPPELASGEIGVLSGCCYSCLSIFTSGGDSMVGRVRIRAAVAALYVLGVRLFDAGTSAQYFVDHFGYRRVTRLRFANMWRASRFRSPQMLLERLSQDGPTPKLCVGDIASLIVSVTQNVVKPSLFDTEINILHGLKEDRYLQKHKDVVKQTKLGGCEEHPSTKKARPIRLMGVPMRMNEVELSTALQQSLKTGALRCEKIIRKKKWARNDPQRPKRKRVDKEAEKGETRTKRFRTNKQDEDGGTLPESKEGRIESQSSPHCSSNNDFALITVDDPDLKDKLLSMRSVTVVVNANHVILEVKQPLLARDRHKKRENDV